MCFRCGSRTGAPSGGRSTRRKWRRQRRSKNRWRTWRAPRTWTTTPPVTAAKRTATRPTCPRPTCEIRPHPLSAWLSLLRVIRVPGLSHLLFVSREIPYPCSRGARSFLVSWGLFSLAVTRLLCSTGLAETWFILDVSLDESPAQTAVRLYTLWTLGTTGSFLHQAPDPESMPTRSTSGPFFLLCLSIWRGQKTAFP